jgi:hypothetical protein
LLISALLQIMLLSDLLVFNNWYLHLSNVRTFVFPLASWNSTMFTPRKGSPSISVAGFLVDSN